MNDIGDVGIEIAILSLGQILAIADESIEDPATLETLERQVRQVAAILQGKPHNKPDDETLRLIEGMRNILGETKTQLAVAG